jgi:hypothetical protein
MREGELEAVHAAVREAGGLRREVDAALGSQAFPYLSDTVGGFRVHMEPTAPGEWRYVGVSLSGPGGAVELHDTALAGSTAPDRTRVDAAACADWEGIEAFLIRYGVVLEARAGNRKASLRVADGALEIRAGKAGRPVASITFAQPRRSLLVEAAMDDGARLAGVDWILVRHALAKRGIQLVPKAVRARS